MINVVELLIDDEFREIDGLRSSYLKSIDDCLTASGYRVSAVDRSDWYSFERKIIVDTNAPPVLINAALSLENERHHGTIGVLVS
jgi:hypothetical protein